MLSFIDKLALYGIFAILFGFFIDHFSNHNNQYQKKPYYKYESHKKSSYHTNVRKPRLRYSKEVNEYAKKYKTP